MSIRGLVVSSILLILFIGTGAYAYQIAAASQGSSGRDTAIGQAVREAAQETRDDRLNGALSGNRLGQLRREVDPLASVQPSPFLRRGERASEAQIQACQARERGIQRRAEHLVRFATNMLAVFDRITQHVQQFYTTVVIPRGQTLTNYDDLLVAIDEKKAAVEAALTQATESAASFSCDNDNPKASTQAFRSDMQTVKSTLHTMRRSVRDLIVAVRTLAHRTAPVTTPSHGVSPTPVVISPTP